MLSKTDLQWLEGRKVMCPRCDCYVDHLTGHSSCHRGKKSGWKQTECRFFYRHDLLCDLKDAADFEERVQKHLMRQYEKVVQCAEVTGSFCPSREIMLMFARLEAEKEMPI